MNPKGRHAPSPSHRQAALRQAPQVARASASVTRPQVPAKAANTRRRTVSTTKVNDPSLIRALVKEANRRGHQLQDMAKALGCTYSYIAQLRGGFRKTEHIGQDFAEKVAAYLGIPPALVKVLAGRVTLSDFLWPQRDPQQDIADCLEALRQDPVVGCYVPNELDEAAPEVQRFVWQLYTECAERHPTPSRELPRMMYYLQRATVESAEYEQELAELRDQMSQPGVQAKELD